MPKPDIGKYLNFYREQSEISSPGKYDCLFNDLPVDVRELCNIVQGLLLHQFCVLDEESYAAVSAESLKDSGRDLNAEINLRSVEEILGFLLQMADRPLTAPRDIDKRVVGNCRDYSLLLVSMLRHHGIPARVRSGVDRYLGEEGFFEDHFICEFWNQAEERWQQVDAQVDEVDREALSLSMDTADLPPNQFLNAGESYIMLKEGQVEPEKIGIFDFTGEMYVRYKLISDLACVNSVEVLPWEGWGICEHIGKNALSEEDEGLLEEIARILVVLSRDGSQFQRARELFEKHPRLQIPADYSPYYMELPDFK